MLADDESVGALGGDGCALPVPGGEVAAPEEELHRLEGVVELVAGGAAEYVIHPLAVLDEYLDAVEVEPAGAGEHLDAWVVA